MKATTKNTILLLTLPLALCVGSPPTQIRQRTKTSSQW
mgnify:CR=1 FL=1